MRLPQVSVRRTSGSSPSRVHVYHRRRRLEAFEINDEMRCMKLRELLDELRCRPRERDALGGPMAESAAMFRLVALGSDFKHWCRQNR